MTYQQALKYLLEQLPMFQRVGAAAYRSDLTNIVQLCNIIGNPQRDIKCIHVAGTNGKGSVTHILASILQEGKKDVGVFVSPHYKDYRERIKINGQLINKQFVSQFVEQYQEEFKRINASFFEITTAMAFAYFKHKKVDYAVIETGLGGRLDSTNIISPILSVITNIGYDHQQFLGNTLEKIAGEKSGIIKQGVPVVIGETHFATRNVFIDKAEQTNSKIAFADLEYDLVKHLRFKKNTFETFRIKKRESGIPVDYNTDLTGAYQAKNIITALSALDMLSHIGIVVPDYHKTLGLMWVRRSTGFAGRWMVLNKSPLTVLDSAHNVDGLRTLNEELEQLKFTHLHFVYGTVKDKDIRRALSLLPKHATYYFCKANLPRGLDAGELKQQAAEFNLHGEMYESVAAAFAAAKKQAQKPDMILVAGSVFVVAEVL